MKKHAILLGTVLLGLVSVLSYAQAPVPFISLPLVPDATSPGGPEFTLTVNGTGFVSNSVVNWNGKALATQFISGSQLTATVPAANIATATTGWVTVVSPAPGGGTSNTAFFTVTLPTSSVAFQATSLTATIGQETVATGDFNRDGKLDLVTVGNTSDLASVFLGNGDGTFQAPTDYPVGGCPSSVVVGDFNGDGIMDLAIRNQCYPYSVSILLGNGDGTFQAAVNFPAGGGVSRMVAGDFNGDGKLDLATTNGLDNTVSILLGNGDGTFQPHVDYAVGPGALPIALGDVNGDGKLDLAVFSEGGNPGLAILLGNGDGTFESFATYAAGCGSDLTDCTAAAADLNGDGVLDLVARNSVLLGNGDGTFQNPVTVAAGSEPEQVTVGDFNGDGKLDLAVADYDGDTVSILLQVPTGPAVTFTPSSLTFGSQPVGTFSQNQVVTLTNTGSGTVTFSAIPWTSGDYYQSNDCPRSLLSQASCTFNVMFTPTVAGTRAGRVNVSDSAPNSPQKLPLTGTATGTGKIILTLSPATLDFGSVAVGTSGSPQSVTVTNVGTVAASFVHPFGFNTAGADCSDFQIASQCGTSLAPNASCQVLVTFEPKASGTRTGTFGVLQGARTVYIPMSGTGTQ